ncbi:MAG: 2-oxo acid dehydrogenase subunit E2, partial [Gammaproteobacteria bacterium]|nr:2-oxo acid dehydrogenase subunit E2 [Gammaproteobacteria bacterium]
MKEEIKVPTMGESITEAVVGNFLKPSGAQVQEEDELLELETEKVNQVLYAPFAGIVTWSVSEGDAVNIGDVLGTIDSEGAPAAAPPPEKKVEEPPTPSCEAGRGKREMQADFVESLKEVPPPPSPVIKESSEREVRKQMPKIRQTIGRRLVDSLHTAAMLTTFNEVDMSAIIALRTKYKESFLEKHGVKLGFMSFFVKAVVEGLKTLPDFNSYIDGDEIVERKYFDVGIAVGTERGLVVPV